MTLCENCIHNNVCKFKILDDDIICNYYINSNLIELINRLIEEKEI